MQKRETLYKIIMPLIVIGSALTLSACKKTWTEPRPANTPTPKVKVVDTSSIINGSEESSGNNLVPLPTLFPDGAVRGGTPTPTPTNTPTPRPTATPKPTPTAKPTPTLSPVPTPTSRPTNTPRPPKQEFVPPTPTADPTCTPTPGSVDYLLVSGTPTPTPYKGKVETK